MAYVCISNLLKENISEGAVARDKSTKEPTHHTAVR